MTPYPVKWKGQIVATRRAKKLHTAISAVDFEAEREAPDVGTMLVGDSVLISDNQSIKTVPAGKVKAIADTMPRPKLTLEKAAHGAAKNRLQSTRHKNGKRTANPDSAPITHNTVKLHSTYGTDIYRSNRDREAHTSAPQ